METRLLLGGGGSEEDEYPIHALFAAWVKPGPILYLPIAMEIIGAPQEKWIGAALTPHGISRISMWKSLAGHTAAELNAYTGIFIGGGNTFHLLKQLRDTGFDRAISTAVANGVPVYGGSAGAIIMGKDISPCVHIDPNNVGLTDLHALDLLTGDSIWCHYQPTDQNRVRAYVKSSRSTTYALPENAGLWVRAPHDYVPLGPGQILRCSFSGETLLNKIDPL
jgi:dipeptidase E